MKIGGVPLTWRTWSNWIAVIILCVSAQWTQQQQQQNFAAAATAVEAKFICKFQIKQRSQQVNRGSLPSPSSSLTPPAPQRVESAMESKTNTNRHKQTNKTDWNGQANRNQIVIVVVLCSSSPSPSPFSSPTSSALLFAYLLSFSFVATPAEYIQLQGVWGN